MSVVSAIRGAFRAALVAAATGVVVFVATDVLQPFARTAPASPAAVGDASGSASLQSRIEAARIALRDAEAALDAAKAVPAADMAAQTQYEAQIAAATERRDLALRHAWTIRAALDVGMAPSLAEIRDSVLIGQLLAQQVALDTQIATEGARLQPSHPTMRALNARRASLVSQIQTEASNFATALEAEAKIDDAQIRRLQGQLSPTIATADAANAGMLETKVATQRAELDSLVDAYFDIPADAAGPTSDVASFLNLAAAVLAAGAVVVFQIGLASRRRRLAHAADLAKWRDDEDVEAVVIPMATARFRKAA